MMDCGDRVDLQKESEMMRDARSKNTVPTNLYEPASVLTMKSSAKDDQASAMGAISILTVAF